MTTTPFDPGEPFREEWVRKMEPLRRAAQDAARAAMPMPIISDRMLEAIRQASAVQIPPGTVQFLQEQMRESQRAIAQVVRRASADYEAAAADLARLGGAIATAAAVRVAAEEEPRSPTASDEPTFTEADVQRIVASAVREVTGNRLEGWRWLFCTPVGLATFAGILLTAAYLVFTCTYMNVNSPPAEEEKVSGAAEHVQTPEGRGEQGLPGRSSAGSPKAGPAADDGGAAGRDGGGDSGG